MRIEDNKRLILNVKNPDRITSVIPKSKVIQRAAQGAKVAVHWGLEEATILKNLGFDNVPSPILRDYNWPGIDAPLSHQKTTAAFLTIHRRGYCFNQQGTGKTRSALWACDYLMNKGVIKKVLILCPLSIMESAWVDDLFKTAMHRTVRVAYSRNAKTRRQIIAENHAEFVIMNYDGLDIAKKEIEAAGFDLVIVDECFTAGTSVHTPKGMRPIEQLKSGDEVLTSSGVMRIRQVICNETKYLVEVKLIDGRTIKCTPDHPFFTDVGWVCAKNLSGRRLISKNEVSRLRADLLSNTKSDSSQCQETCPGGVHLLKILCSEEMEYAKPREELLLSYASRRSRLSHKTENVRTPYEAVIGIESARASPNHTHGERDRDDYFRTIDFRGFTCGVGMELPSSIGEEAARLSYQLQAGFCMAPSENRLGSGWKQPYCISQTAPRQKERTKASESWVESVSHIKCQSPEAVYNLRIDGTPNYFVGDAWLVHNCNAMKSATTKRWKTFNSLLKPNMWLWMMTGTPAAQSPIDAYGLAKLVSPSKTPQFFGTFRDQVMLKVTNFKWVPKPDADRIVHNLLQPAIRFTKEECLDLPEMTYVTRDTPLTPQQNKYYEILRKHFLAQAAGEDITAVNAAAGMNKLLQISAGSVYSDNKEIVEFDCKNRLTVLKEVIDESSNKVLVFIPYRHAIERVTEALRSDGYDVEIINGAVSAGRRTEIFKTFQTTPKIKVLIIQPQAASHGVTLHAADTIVYWSPVLSVETYLQCNARVHRAGLRHPATVVHLQGSPIEKKVYKMLQDKVDSHEKLVDLYKEVLNEY